MNKKQQQLSLCSTQCTGPPNGTVLAAETTIMGSSDLGQRGTWPASQPTTAALRITPRNPTICALQGSSDAAVAIEKQYTDLRCIEAVQ